MWLSGTVELVVRGSVARCRPPVHCTVRRSTVSYGRVVFSARPCIADNAKLKVDKDGCKALLKVSGR